jgi:hypothetical protein
MAPRSGRARVRHFPGAGNYRECDAANLAEPAPTLLSCCAGRLAIESSDMPPLANVANLTTGYGGLSGLSGLAGSDFLAGSVR